MRRSTLQISRCVARGGGGGFASREVVGTEGGEAGWVQVGVVHAA